MRDDDVAQLFGICIGLTILIVALVIHILFLLTLQKCLSRVAPRNRAMEPGMVWLNLIPCVNLIWIFMTVSNIATSLRNEWRYRRWENYGEGFGQGVGIAYAVLSLISAIPYVNLLTGLPALICWIIYWSQIANYSGQIAQPYEGRDDRDDFDDDYDRRYRRRRDKYPSSRRGERDIDDRYRSEDDASDEAPRRRDADDRFRADE